MLAELETFPDGAHDDHVDALAGAYTWLTENHDNDLNFTGRLDLDLTRTSPWDFDSPDAGHEPRSISRWREL